MSELKDILFYPERYFAHIKKRDSSLKIPILILGFQATMYSILQYFLVRRIYLILPEPVAHIYAISGYMTIIASFLSPFINWLLLSFIMYGLSVFFGGRGSFRRTVEFVGIWVFAYYHRISDIRLYGDQPRKSPRITKANHK